MKRKFLSKTARSQGQSIIYFRDPFRLVPVAQLADIADKFTRNEILSPNEVRAEIGYKPNDDPRSDELRNRNINQNSDEYMNMMNTVGEESEVPEEETQEGVPQKRTPEEREQSIKDIMKLIGGE